jgi:hypothetical protein
VQHISLIKADSFLSLINKTIGKQNAAAYSRALAVPSRK